MRAEAAVPSQQGQGPALVAGDKGLGGERGPKVFRHLQSVGKKQIGSIIEMQIVKKLWQTVRVVDVVGDQVQVVPQKVQGDSQASAESKPPPSSWAMQWVEFKKGLFRARLQPVDKKTSQPSPDSTADTIASRAAAVAEELDKRPDRERKKPAAFSSRPHKSVRVSSQAGAVAKAVASKQTIAEFK